MSEYFLRVTVHLVLHQYPKRLIICILQQNWRVCWIIKIVVFHLSGCPSIFYYFVQVVTGIIPVLLVSNLKQNSMARRHALFLGRHALSDSAMPFCLAPCHQNVPLIKIFTCLTLRVSINIVLPGDCTRLHLANTS